MSDFDQPAANPTTVSGHERLTTLSLVDEASIKRRAPAYDPDKGMANHKAFLRYVRQAYEGATPQTLVQAGLGEIADKSQLSETWSRYADQVMEPGALADDSTAAITPAEGVSEGNLMLIDLANRVTPAKSGVRIARRTGERVDVRSAADLLATHTIREDFKRHVHSSGAEASVLTDQDIDQFFRRSVGDSRNLTPKNIGANFPLDYKRFELISPASREVIAEALGVDLQSQPEGLSPAMREAISQAMGVDLPSEAPTTGKAPQSLADAMAAASPDQLAKAMSALKESSLSINKSHYAPMLQRTMLARSYDSFMRDTMDRIIDVQQQRRYERTIAEGDSATVYQQKKNVPETHIDAAKRSVFAASGDFAHVEIDESVELGLMGQIEKEWAVLREALPHSPKKADLRFRKTGRHKAAGVYHPTMNNIAVDPRHPYSFVHEYMHHLDYTLGADKDTRQLSLSEDFAPMLHGVQANMRGAEGIDKLDYYTTPTEVFARGGELVCYWSGLATSLNGDAAKYDTPVYKAYEPYREQLIAWYNERLGLDIAHEHAVTPEATARPGLSELHSPHSTSAPGEQTMDTLAH